MRVTGGVSALLAALERIASTAYPDDSCFTVIFSRNTPNEAPRVQVWNRDLTAANGRAMAILDVVHGADRALPDVKGSLVAYGDNYNVADYAGFVKLSANVGNGLIIRASEAAAIIKILCGGDLAANEMLRIQAGAVDLRNNAVLRANGTQVLTSRRTGWAAPTGTATRTTFATGTVTLVQLAERVKALIDDLTTHGVIGP